MVVFQGDLGCYLQKKGRLSPSKALRFALDIARQVLIFSYCILFEELMNAVILSYIIFHVGLSLGNILLLLLSI